MTTSEKPAWAKEPCGDWRLILRETSKYYIVRKDNAECKWLKTSCKTRTHSEHQASILKEADIQKRLEQQAQLLLDVYNVDVKLQTIKNKFEHSPFTYRKPEPKSQDEINKIEQELYDVLKGALRVIEQRILIPEEG